MRVRIISFTEKGYALAEKMAAALTDHDAQTVPRGTSAAQICREAFRDRDALVFIGAAGIAVRSIAPYLKDKLTDPPVIVIDEEGRFAVPILSGHMGGANELALAVAGSIGAQPVLTTATDVSGAFSVDLFAKENGLRIVNREGIAKVSSSALSGKAVTICIKDFPPETQTDVLITDDIISEGSEEFRSMASIVLCPKKYALGVGCRRGKSFSELRAFAEKVLEDNGIDISDVGAVATIDVKKDEEGIIRLSEYLRAPLITFEASVLAKVPGSFSSSERVLRAVGVDNVCERAAAAAAGRDHELAVKKTAADGMTIAVALRKSQAGN